MLTDTAYGADPFSSGFFNYFGFLGQLFSGLGIFIFLIALGYILYYYTGNEKKGEVLIKNMARVAGKTYNYMWMFVGSFFVFFGLQRMLYFIFFKLLPEDDSRFSSPDIDSKTIVVGLVVLLFGIGLVAVHYIFNNLFLTATEKKGTLVTKTILAIASMVYAIIGVVSGIMVLIAIVNVMYDDASTVDSGTIATLIASSLVLAPMLYMGYIMIRNEKQIKTA